MSPSQPLASAMVSEAAAEVTVRRRRAVDRAKEIERLDQRARAEVEHVDHGLLDLALVDLRRAERVDVHADGWATPMA
jgi:hypothetical protein